MTDSKSRGKLFVYAILIVLLLFGLIKTLVSAGGKMFLAESLCFVVLLFLAVLGFAGYLKAWGEKVLFFVFLLYLLNLVFVWYFSREISVILLILAVIGFLMAIPQKRCSSCQTKIVDFEEKTSVKIDQKEKTSEESHSQVFGAEEEVKPEIKQPINPKKEFVPGKFVASKKGNQYHLPKCDWAKKIAKSNRVWLKSKEEAWEKGYRAHDCVK